MKKMRKLLPAFAMLLVSAIMMSTASFAWFTMNEEVTATGMNIQAQAGGSLVIGDAPLFYSNDDPSVNLNGETANLLKPITWDETAWMVANGSEVDVYTGDLKGDAELVSAGTIDAADNPYFIDREIYLGSAGDTLYNKSITVNMSAIAVSAKDIYKAYAVAIYVVGTAGAAWNDGVTVSTTQKPDAFVYVDTASSRNVAVLRGQKTTVDGTDYYAGYTIPSIVGVEGTGNEGVGFKIVIRFFVDGDLQALQADGTPATKDKDVISYTPATGTYNPDVTYYANAEGTATANVNNMTAGDSIDTKGWFVRTVTKTPVQYKYVNTDNVPMTGSTLKLIFSSASEPQPPVSGT